MELQEEAGARGWSEGLRHSFQLRQSRDKLMRLRQREMRTVFSVEPASYVVVPSCFVSEQGEFYLRVLAERDVKKEE